MKLILKFDVINVETDQITFVCGCFSYACLNLKRVSYTLLGN